MQALLTKSPLLGGLAPIAAHRQPRACICSAGQSSMGSTDSGKILSDSATSSFMQWARSAGITSTSLAPALFGGLRGMAASEAIEADDLLIRVPRYSAIVLSPRIPCPFPDFVDKDYWQTAPWFVKLALMLLHQKQQGQQARLAGYVEQLPSRVDLPVLWDDAALQQLQYAHLIHQARPRDPHAGCTHGRMHPHAHQKQPPGLWLHHRLLPAAVPASRPAMHAAR
jgi:hypothetical protein